MFQNEAPRRPRPPNLVEKQVPEPIINRTIIIQFESLRLMRARPDHDIRPEIDKVSEKSDLIPRRRIRAITSRVFLFRRIGIAFVILHIHDH